MLKKKKNLFILLVVAILSIGNYLNVSATSDSNYIPNIQLEETGNNKTVNIATGKNNKDTLDKGKDEKNKIFNKVLTEYRSFVIFLMGIGIFSMIMFFILNFLALANSKGNPQAREKAIHGLIVTGIATAGLGAVTTITTLFYNMIKDKNV